MFGKDMLVFKRINWTFLTYKFIKLDWLPTWKDNVMWHLFLYDLSPLLITSTLREETMTFIAITNTAHGPEWNNIY